MPHVTDPLVLTTSTLSVGMLIAFQAVDAILTLVHSLQELKGRLWDYFGAIVGVRIPTWIGVVGFFGLLTVFLWAVGAVAIWGTARRPSPWTVGAVGLLIGCRISDAIFSHLLLHVRHYRPNPGLQSVPLYIVEALLLLVVFRAQLTASAWSAVLGFGAGSLLFFVILPLLGRCGPRFWPVRDPWRPGTPRPT